MSDKSANMADWLESRLHRDFTVMADDLFGDGRLTREERIALSGLIGNALDVFHQGLQSGELSDLYSRRPYQEVEVEALKSAIEKQPFTVWKQKDGRYRWFAVFSNPYRDQDHPPEILTEAAQIDNVKAINDGLWPYPELWLWHIPGSRCGLSDFIAYDTDNRLSLSSGLFDKGKESVAEALNSTPVKLKTSHGMPRSEIQRDKDDPTILTRFRTKEISPLPEGAAANEITGFKILGGNMKLVPEIVKEKLSAIFPDEEVQKKIAETLDEMGDEAKEKELEFKDTEVVEVETEEKSEDETETETEVKAEAETEVEEPTVEPLDRKEVEDALALMVKGINTLTQNVEEIKTLYSELQTTFSDRLDALEKSDEEKIAEKTAYTPRASLSEIIQLSVIGKEETRVDGRKARHEGPEETKDSIVRTGNPILDSVMTGIVEGGISAIN